MLLVSRTRGNRLESVTQHISKLRGLGFGNELVASFENEWKSLEADGFDVYGVYTGQTGSTLDGMRACVICSKNSTSLHWRKVITPSMDSAAIYSVCSDCDSQYVETALKQKALGRLLKERNTRPS